MKKTLLTLSMLLMVSIWHINAQDTTSFITTWKTDNYGLTNDTSIKIPTFSGETYNYDVDWNNDGVFDELGIAGDITHDFGTAGTYTIRIRGVFPRIFFNNGGDHQKIIRINQWGANQWSSMEGAFYGCGNINDSISDIPDLSQVTSTSNMFRTSNFNQPIDNWDVSHVTDMSNMFGSSSFGQPLNNWDVLNVTNMSGMFNSSSYNQAIDDWDVSSVTDMSYMFENAFSFNQPIGRWDVSQVTNMNSMFKDAYSFNQPIGNWDVGNVTNMSRMFKGRWGYAFNQPIGNWHVNNVTDMFEMFHTADHFNQFIGDWNVSNVTNMDSMFLNARAYNQPMNNWNVINVLNMEDMFLGAYAFNQPLDNWDVSNVTNMNGMFEDANAFDQNIGGWNISNVTSISRMFRYADGLSVQNYDNLLIGWSALTLHSNLVFQAQSATYCNGATARTAIINNFGWSIYDGGEDPNCGITCPAPSTLTANNLTLTGADLSWTENGTATQWDIEIGIQGFTPTGTPTNENVSNPFTWTAGLEDTSYDYYVRADCSGDNADASIWVGPYTFTTASSVCSVCVSNGNTTFDTGTTLVQFGTINNASGKAAYTDYTNISTDVQQGNTYNLTVHVNSDGDWQVNTVVWIDWNQNCSFDDPGEEYILGTAQDVSDGATSNSPLPITVPANALLGTTIMRVATKYNSNATSCGTGYDGEVEDYSLEIIMQDCTNDTTAPVPDIATLPDITAECEVTSLTPPTATDNCATTITVTNNATLPITTQGTTIVTWTFDDGNGNTATQVQNIIIDDVTNPMPYDSTLPDITAECEVTSLTPPTATDNCATTITVTNNATLPITTQGTTIVTWTFDDGNGNTATQVQNIIIDDVTNPMPYDSTLPDITAECEVTSLTPPTATDNCATTVTVTNNATLPITTQGTTVVTWTFDDGNGNTATQTQRVIIDDVIAPYFDTTIMDIYSECEVTSLIPPQAYDNCAGTVTVTHNATLPITTQGTTVVTWTLDDGNGNTATVTQNVIYTPIVNTVTQSGYTLTADATGSYTYQWGECSGSFAPLTNENGQSFTPTQDGNYAVAITNGTCIIMSDCITITGLAVNDTIINNIIVYPNPVKSIVNIALSDIGNYQIKLIDLTGKELMLVNVINKNSTILDMSNLKSGIYLLSITDKKNNKSRIIKLQRE